MIKGFVFDLDGVITETAELHFLAWKEILNQKGINYTKEENDKLKGLPRLDTLLEILKLKKLSGIFSEEQIDEICTLKNELYLNFIDTKLDEKNILPGIKKFLIEAKNNNFKMSIASSSHNARKILEKIKLINFFDFVVDAKKIKLGKPHPQIFIDAAKGINLNPEECIGFEDSLAGLSAIISSKMKSIAISHNSKEDFSKADLVILSTDQLNFEFVKKYFKIK